MLFRPLFQDIPFSPCSLLLHIQSMLHPNLPQFTADVESLARNVRPPAYKLASSSTPPGSWSACTELFFPDFCCWYYSTLTTLHMHARLAVCWAVTELPQGGQHLPLGCCVTRSKQGQDWGCQQPQPGLLVRMAWLGRLMHKLWRRLAFKLRVAVAAGAATALPAVHKGAFSRPAADCQALLRLSRHAWATCQACLAHPRCQ